MHSRVIFWWIPTYLVSLLFGMVYMNCIVRVVLVAIVHLAMLPIRLSAIPTHTHKNRISTFDSASLKFLDSLICHRFRWIHITAFLFVHCLWDCELAICKTKFMIIIDFRLTHFISLLLFKLFVKNSSVFLCIYVSKFSNLLTFLPGEPIFGV